MIGNFKKIHVMLFAAAFIAIVFLIRPVPSFAASIASGSAITEDCVTKTVDASGTIETQCSNARDGYIVMLIEIGVFSIAAAGTLIFFKK